MSETQQALTNTMPLPRVVIESPFAGDVERNIRFARACVRDSVLRGEAPIASHLLFTQEGILRDEVHGERALGIAAGHAWIVVCDFVAAYTNFGISRGMQAGLDEAGRRGKPIVIRRLDGWS